MGISGTHDEKASENDGNDARDEMWRTFLRLATTLEEQAQMAVFRGAMDEDNDRYYEHQALLMEGPPDYPLLTDPYTVLTNPLLTPEYVSEAVMRESFAPWLHRTLIAFGAEKGDEYLHSIWPFPIGRESFAADRGVQTEFGSSTRLRRQRALPFYGDEYAALALTVEREGVTVSVFGMLMAVSEGCDLRYECVPAQVSWHGASPYTAPGR